MPRSESQVWEAAINLTVSFVMFYLVSTLLPGTYSHLSKPSSKASSLHISKLDSASGLIAWHFVLLSLKIPTLGSVVSAMCRGPV